MVCPHSTSTNERLLFVSRDDPRHQLYDALGSRRPDPAAALSAFESLPRRTRDKLPQGVYSSLFATCAGCYGAQQGESPVQASSDDPERGRDTLNATESEHAIIRLERLLDETDRRLSKEEQQTALRVSIYASAQRLWGERAVREPGYQRLVANERRSLERRVAGLVGDRLANSHALARSLPWPLLGLYARWLITFCPDTHSGRARLLFYAFLLGRWSSNGHESREADGPAVFGDKAAIDTCDQFVRAADGSVPSAIKPAFAFLKFGRGLTPTVGPFVSLLVQRDWSAETWRRVCQSIDRDATPAIEGWSERVAQALEKCLVGVGRRRGGLADILLASGGYGAAAAAAAARATSLRASKSSAVPPPPVPAAVKPSAPYDMIAPNLALRSYERARLSRLESAHGQRMLDEAAAKANDIDVIFRLLEDAAREEPAGARAAAARVFDRLGHGPDAWRSLALLGRLQKELPELVSGSALAAVSFQIIRKGKIIRQGRWDRHVAQLLEILLGSPDQDRAHARQMASALVDATLQRGRLAPTLRDLALRCANELGMTPTPELFEACTIAALDAGDLANALALFGEALSRQVLIKGPVVGRMMSQLVEGGHSEAARAVNAAWRGLAWRFRRAERGNDGSVRATMAEIESAQARASEPEPVSHAVIPRAPRPAEVSLAPSLPMELHFA